MTETVEILVYKATEHRAIPVTTEAYAKFVSLLPEDARKAFEFDTPVALLGEVVGAVREYMMGYLYRCQTRPALPHEREEHGGVRYLTKKGGAKWDERLRSIASAFREAFGYSAERSAARGPVEGPLDPLIYD